MPDITADLIARIATQLYQNASPAPEPSPESPPVSTALAEPASLVPQAHRQIDIPHTPQPAVSSRSLPSPGAIPGALPSSLATPYSPTAVPGGAALAPASFASGIPLREASVATRVPAVAPAPAETSGLRAFVEQIRTGHIRREGVDSTARSDLGTQFGLASLFPSRDISTTSARAFDVAEIRRDFPILNQKVHGRPLVWLDNAATTHKPQAVIDALSNYYARDNSNIHRAAHTLAARSTDAYEGAREKIQKFLGAGSTREIILVRGTTEGINLIAQTYGRKFLQPGDEIVLSTLEHHANIVPWQLVAKEKGAVIRVIPVTDRGEIMLEEYQALLTPRTRIVSLTHASNSLGTILPVLEMTQMAKRYNARVLIDGAQSVAHIPVNVQQLGCDFYTFSGHKIFGPTGIGAVYAKEELLEIMPPWQGGGNMIRNVTFEETTYAEAPAKFEAGTPNIADAVGLGAALDYVSRLGLPQIARYEHQLLEYATDRLVRIPGLRLIGTAREKVGVLSFVLRDRATQDIGRLLDQQGIAVRAGHHCAQPSLRRYGLESTVRPSLAFYNTCEDVDRLVDAVRRIAVQQG